jgi:ubiquitin thioesterase protein OTUB1
MKLNPHRYQAFLPLPLDQYCTTRIETVKTEIDEVGLQALVDGVIEPSGVAVEILYLDRSQGEAVTPHLLTPSRPSASTIRLLYRPGHYDIAYQAEPTVTMEPIVNYQYGMTTNYSPWDQGALSFDVNSSLMSIPNLMMDPSFALSPSPMTPAPSPYRVSPPQEVFQPPMHTPPPPVPVASPPPPRMSAPPPMTSLPNRSSDGPQIRLNPLVMKQNLSHSLPVTTPFKNSPYNQAHFQNQDFEPIHWEPSYSRK